MLGDNRVAQNLPATRESLPRGSTSKIILCDAVAGDDDAHYHRANNSLGTNCYRPLTSSCCHC